MKDDTLADVHKDRVVPFKPKIISNQNTKTPPSAPIITLLEDYLAAAKQGKITFMACAMLDEAGIAFSSWEPADGPPEFVTSAMGAVSFLNARFLDAALDGSEDYPNPDLGPRTG